MVSLSAARLNIVGVLAASAVLVVRLTATPSGTGALQPAESPPTAPLPTVPIESPVTPSSSPAPPSTPGRFVSPNGDWEFEYPPGWRVLVTQGGFHLMNYPPSAASDGPAPPGHIKVDFSIRPSDEARGDGIDPSSVDRFLATECSRSTREILKCERVEINGRVWGWVHSRITSYGEDPGIQSLQVASVVAGKFYYATGGAGSGPRQDEDIRQQEAIFRTFVVRG